MVLFFRRVVLQPISEIYRRMIAQSLMNISGSVLLGLRSAQASKHIQIYWLVNFRRNCRITFM